VVHWVITALAFHLTIDKIRRDAGRGKLVCFLPTEFQVCLPMQNMMDDGGIHWFLAIILLDEEQVQILDPFPSRERITVRMSVVETRVSLEFLPKTKDYMCQLNYVFQ
ncbi:unnamed protein product, partial [Linum tenue]